MKVLVFTTQFYQLGGAERLAVELAQDLNCVGIHCDVLSQYGETGPGVASKVSELKNAGVPSVLFLGLAVRPSLWAVCQAMLRLRRLVQHGQYDAVETSSMVPNLMACVALLGTGVRNIVGIHDIYQRDRQTSARHLVWRLCMRWNRSIHFYAITESVRTSWIAYSSIRPERVTVVANSIGNEYFTVQPRLKKSALVPGVSIAPSARIILFVGRLLKRKGVDTLIDGVGPILVPTNSHLVVVGDVDRTEHIFADEGQVLERIAAKVRAADWGARVHFVGHRSDGPALMAIADVLVHPARVEGFGLILAEALASGLPVVASNVDGIPEVLAGTDSVMVGPDDPEALGEAVARVMAWPSSVRAAAVTRGRKKAERYRTRRRTDEMTILLQGQVRS